MRAFSKMDGTFRPVVATAQRAGRHLAAAAALLLACGLCAVLNASEPQERSVGDGPQISNVVAEKRVLDRDQPAPKLAWRYRLNSPAKITASIYDSRNVLIRRIVDGEQVPAGDARMSWNGKDDQGRMAPIGYYVLTIRAEADGKSSLYDPTDRTGGTLIQASGERYDAETQRLYYTLPEHALVRVHLGLTNGLLLRTPVDWVARTAGEHFEPWDGTDESRVMNFGSSAMLDIQVWAYRLPINAVVVTAGRQAKSATVLPATEHSGAAVAPSVRSAFLDFETDRERREVTRERKLEMYNHWTQNRETARNPKIFLTAPDGWPKQGDAVLVERPVGLRLGVIEEDQAFLLAERFETVVYLDGSFVFEEEQGYLPFTWRLRPDLLPPGEHIVTFMIRGYDGHFGSASIKVFRPVDRAASQAESSGAPAPRGDDG